MMVAQDKSPHHREHVRMKARVAAPLNRSKSSLG